MNKRIVSIIQVLAESEKEYTIRDLAGEYSCSERTIRNDLNSISDLLRENGLTELTLKHGGRIIRAEDFRRILPEVTGGCPITYIFVQLFTRENIMGLIAIGAMYVVCMFFAVMHSRQRAIEVAGNRDEDDE